MTWPTVPYHVPTSQLKGPHFPFPTGRLETVPEVRRRTTTTIMQGTTTIPQLFFIEPPTAAAQAKDPKKSPNFVMH